MIVEITGYSSADSHYSHGFCLNCCKIRPVRFHRAGNEEDAPTDIVCDECHFIIATLHKRAVKAAPPPIP